MPTYGYRCEKNGHEFEVVQSFSDPPLTRCKICGSKVNRIFYPVGIVFKGPGFYSTDNRAAARASTAADRTEDDTKSSDADAKAAKPEPKTASTEKSKTSAKPKGGKTSKN